MKLEGGINFRDMGGYLTKDGRRIKRQKFFRSGSLSRLTANDCQALEALSIKYILDYRDHHESENDKDVIWTGVQHECAPANPRSHQSTPNKDFFSEEVLSGIQENYMESLYRLLPFANPAYQRLFHKVENLGEGALVQHCAVGKDRTGVGSALLLLALGTTKETVFEDYLITEERLGSYRNEVLSRIAGKFSEKALTNFQYMMRANEKFLHAGLEAIIERYGNFEDYFSAEFNLTTDKLAALRARYTEEV
jgi:protein tyrosine/serine phosphatase